MAAGSALAMLGVLAVWPMHMERPYRTGGTAMVSWFGAVFFLEENCGLPSEKLRYSPKFFDAWKMINVFQIGPLLRGHYIHLGDDIFFLLQEFLHGVEADEKQWMKFTHGKNLMIPHQRVSFFVNNFD